MWCFFEWFGLDVGLFGMVISFVNWMYLIRNWFDDWGVFCWMVEWFFL